MSILIVGDTGNAGSRTVTEAVRRGHRVTAAARHPRAVAADGVAAVLLDGADSALVADAARGHDVVVGATRPEVGSEDDVIATTRGLAEGARAAGVRLVVIGGAAPLLVPGSDRCARQLGVLESVAECD